MYCINLFTINGNNCNMHPVFYVMYNAKITVENVVKALYYESDNRPLTMKLEQIFLYTSIVITSCVLTKDTFICVWCVKEDHVSCFHRLLSNMYEIFCPQFCHTSFWKIYGISLCCSTCSVFYLKLPELIAGARFRTLFQSLICSVPESQDWLMTSPILKLLTFSSWLTHSSYCTVPWDFVVLGF